MKRVNGFMRPEQAPYLRNRRIRSGRDLRNYSWSLQIAEAGHVQEPPTRGSYDDYYRSRPDKSYLREDRKKQLRRERAMARRLKMEKCSE